MNGFNLTQDIQPQTTGLKQSSPQTDILLIIALGLLLVFSAIPLTADAAMYIGLFLLFLTWLGAKQSGGLQTFWTEITS